MVTPGSPCTSQDDPSNHITSGELEELITHQEDVCILDFRSGGSSLKCGTRVHLPHVLFRRLQNGSLPLTNISSRLSCLDLPIVIIPEEEETQSSQSKSLMKALNKNGNTSVRVLNEDVERVLNKYPHLGEEIRQKKSEDLTCLNLNSLRIEGTKCNDLPSPSSAMSKTNDKRQIFPVLILPHLYLGNAETAKNQELLESYNIHYIINVTSNLPNFFQSDPFFHYLRICVDDNASFNLSQFFPEAISFIEEAASAGKACLVHCLAGISRSVTICLAYLMAKKEYSLEEAYDVVLRRNASIAPNFHFMGQLTDYERHLGIPSRKSSAPRSPSCSAQAASLPSSCLTPPPTGFSSSPHSSAAKRGFED